MMKSGFKNQRVEFIDEYAILFVRWRGNSNVPILMLRENYDFLYKILVNRVSMQFTRDLAYADNSITVKGKAYKTKLQRLVAARELLTEKYTKGRSFEDLIDDAQFDHSLFHRLLEEASMDKDIPHDYRLVIDHHPNHSGQDNRYTTDPSKKDLNNLRAIAWLENNGNPSYEQFYSEIFRNLKIGERVYQPPSPESDEDLRKIVYEITHLKLVPFEYKSLFDLKDYPVGIGKIESSNVLCQKK